MRILVLIWESDRFSSPYWVYVRNEDDEYQRAGFVQDIGAIIKYKNFHSPFDT